MFKRKKIDLEGSFGADLAAKITGHLGPEGAAEFAKKTIAEAKGRWSRRSVQGVLSEEEQARLHREAQNKGFNTIEQRAAFLVLAMAAKIAGEVATKAIAAAELPGELESELVERLTKLLD